MNVRHDVFIDGKWCDSRSAARIVVTSPATETLIGEVPDANAEDVDAAVSAARRAFDEGPWPALPLEERAALIERALALLEPKLGAIADLVTSQMGLPAAVSRQKAPAGVWVGRYFIDLARGDVRSDIRTTRWGPAAVLREPVGVVAAITPWNSPFNMAIAKIAPALISGCTVVFKPAPETPLDAYVVAEAFREAGLPPGVFNMLTGGRETGRALVTHRGIDKVSFTGSTVAGREIARTAGANFTRLQLELGGKSAAIVADDADIDTVRRGIVEGTFSNTGQLCSAYTRILVPARQYAKWLDVVVEAAESFVVGDPYDAATTMGPVASRAQRDRVMGYIESGKAEGAKVATGGTAPALPGFYVDPTVFAGADNAMRISREEIFGPVAVVIPYETLDGAIAIANDSEYGLHGGVFSENPQTAARVARAVRAGTFSINGFTHNVQAPFGGVKGSGVGRELGLEGLHAFYELKTVNLTASTVPLFEASSSSNLQSEA